MRAMSLKPSIFEKNKSLKYMQHMSDITSRVKAIIVDKLGVDENEVVKEASFTNDLVPIL